MTQRPNSADFWLSSFHHVYFGNRCFFSIRNKIWEQIFIPIFDSNVFVYRLNTYSICFYPMPFASLLCVHTYYTSPTQYTLTPLPISSNTRVKSHNLHVFFLWKLWISAAKFILNLFIVLHSDSSVPYAMQLKKILQRNGIEWWKKVMKLCLNSW